MFVLDLFNTKYEKELREGAVDKVVSEGGPYDLPGIDYDRPGDAPRRPRPQGDTSSRRHPDDPDYMDPDQRRLRADQERVKKAWAAKNKGVAEEYTRGAWKDEALDYKDFADLAYEKLTGAYGDKRRGIAQYYSRLENRTFGSDINQHGYTQLLIDLYKKANRDFTNPQDDTDTLSGTGFGYVSQREQGVAEGSGQDSKSWMASIRQQHPDVRFVQAKMPGAPIMAMVNGKPVAQWDGKQQGELPLQEKKRSDRELNATVGDTKVARELQKLRAQYPAARNDVEVVAKSEIDSNERSQQQLAAINGANTEQDQLLKQLVALDKQQGKEIGSLDNENDRLEQQLKHVEQTNAKLAQAIDQIAGETPSKGADDAGPTRSKSVNLAPADAPAQPQAKREPSDATPKSDAINRMARDLTQPRKVKGTNQGNVTNLDAFRRAQAAVTNKDFNPMIKAMLDKGVLSRTGTDDRLNEFAPSAGGGSGDYFQALASAWYNGAFDTGSLEKGIKSKEDVERLLNRGIIGPDGVTRKYAIDYNSTFEGVVISSDDYYEHSDYNDQGQEVDSRNGRPWGPYDYMEFDDEELDESAKWRDPKYKGQLYTQEPPDYNDTREYDNARFNPKPKGYAGRKELPGGGEYDRTDPLRRGQGIGRSGIKNNINLSGKRKGLPSRDQITSLKGSIKDAHGTHTRPNLPEQGVAEGIVDALKGSWEKVKNFDSPARSTSNTQRYQDLRKRQELKRKQIKNQVPVNELSTDKLAQYKIAAALDAGAADKRGDYERGDKRFAGIVKATKKQFANDLKKHGQQGVAEGAPISGDGGAVDNFKQQMANNTEIAYQKGMAEAKKKKKKKSSRSLGRYFFPGYGYYGSGESGEGGGDGGGGEGESVNRAVAEGSSTASDAVERAILNRIMVQHTDLLMRFGPDKVMQAAEEVAYNVGDVDEIGTSDVSAYVNQVRQILGA
jgi:hypothetical protein